MAVALPRHQPRRALVALVAVVNRRPRGSQAPDVSRILLGTRLSRAMRAPTVTEATNVLLVAPATAPAACGLGALKVADLRFAMRAGAPPSGFGARSTIAEALAGCLRAPGRRGLPRGHRAAGIPAAAAQAAAVPAVPSAPACAAGQGGHRLPDRAATGGLPSIGVIDCPTPARPRERTQAMSDTTSAAVETDQAAREASGAHPYGRYLEEFEVGAVYKHWPAKTVTEADDHLFCLITMNHHPLHINDVYAAQSQQGRNVVVGPLVYSLALGMSVSDVVGQGDRQPGHRGAQASRPRLPRRHAVRASPRCSRSASRSPSPIAAP